MDLQNKIDSIVSESQGNFGVYIKNLNNEETAYVNKNKLFQLASCFKIPVMATLYRDSEKGSINLNKRIRVTSKDYRTGSGVLEALDPGMELTIKDLAMLMTIVSDNVATDILMELVGTENVDKYMKELGMENTSVKHDVRDAIIYHMGESPEHITDEEFNDLLEKRSNGNKIKSIDADDAPVFKAELKNNVSTPKEMSYLLEMIAKKQLISPAACEGMINILSSQKLRDRIPYLLPSETKVACKTGTIGSVVNDAGFVYLPNQDEPFVIVVFSRGNEHIYDGDAVISQIAKTAYDHFLK